MRLRRLTTHDDAGADEDGDGGDEDDEGDGDGAKEHDEK